MFFFRKIKTEGFVLKKKILFGKDFLVFFFTQDRGKITVLAKGIKKLTSRRISSLETGNLVNIIIEKKKEIFYLKETELKSGFYQIKNNFKKINAIYNFFFILDKLLPENQKEEKVYNIVKKFFIEIDKINDDYQLRNLLYKYINKIFIFLGYLKKEEKLENLRKIFFEITNVKMPFFVI